MLAGPYGQSNPDDEAVRCRLGQRVLGYPVQRYRQYLLQQNCQAVRWIVITELDGYVHGNSLPACPATQLSVRGQICGRDEGVVVWSYFWKRLLGVSTLCPTAIATGQVSSADSKNTIQHTDSISSGRG